MDIDGEASGDKSGYSVSLSSDGRTVAIGAIRNDGNGTDSGHVRIYTLPYKATATFTPNTNYTYYGKQVNNGEVENNISVLANKFTDAYGNYNTTIPSFYWSSDTKPPTIEISAMMENGTSITSGVATNGSAIILTFTASEDISGFSISNVELDGGSLSNFTGNSFAYPSSQSKIYKGTFTPISSDKTYNIKISQNIIKDFANNYNDRDFIFVWTCDRTPPVITITSETTDINNNSISSGDTTNDENILLTFTSNEPTTDFTISDVDVSGTLTAAQGSFGQ